MFMKNPNKMSPPESDVALFLDKLSINYVYEYPIFLFDDEKRPRVWTPDFYLPNLGVYVEVCGTRRTGYRYRRKIYAQNKTKIIFIHYYKDVEKWKKYFLTELSSLAEKMMSEVSRIQRAL